MFTVATGLCQAPFELLDLWCSVSLITKTISLATSNYEALAGDKIRALFVSTLNPKP